MEIESKSFHKLWSCGSASTRGTNLNKTGDNAMQQVHATLYRMAQIFCGL